MHSTYNSYIISGSENSTQIPRPIVNCSIDQDTGKLDCNNVTELGMCQGLEVKCQKRIYNDNCTEYLDNTDQVETNCPTAVLSVLVGLLVLLAAAMMLGGMVYIVKHKTTQGIKQQR